MNDPNGGGACLEINECASLPCRVAWTAGLAAGVVTNVNSCVDHLDFYVLPAGLRASTATWTWMSVAAARARTARHADSSFAYQCTCANGFNWYNCATDIDECASCVRKRRHMPGLHDGWLCGRLRVHLRGGVPESPGNEDCAIDIDECASSPCVNGATCDDSITDATIPNNHYRCTCAAGFADGVCGYTYISEYTAECTVSTSLANVAFSANCDIDVDECASAPCANGATCHDSADDASIPVHTYQCVCLSGFANGACGYTDYLSEYTAQCTVPNSAANAYTGNCDVDVDECDSSPW